MKGVHPILSHTMLLIVGIAAMGMIILATSSTFASTERSLVLSQVRYVAETLRSRLLEIYGTANSGGNFSGSFALGLPEKIGDQSYVVVLSNGMITVRMPFQREMLEVNKTISIDAQLGGQSMMPASLSVEKLGETITMDLV